MEHNPLSVWPRAQSARGVSQRPLEGKPCFPDHDAVEGSRELVLSE